MEEDEFITYNKYKLMCYNSRINPEKKAQTPFIEKRLISKTINNSIKMNGNDSLKELFYFLSDGKEWISKESIQKYALKFNLDSKKILDLFYILDQDEIGFDLFCYIYGVHHTCICVKPVVIL